MVLVAHQNPTKVLQPRKQSLNLPTALVTAQATPVLRRRLLPVRLMRGNQLYLLLSKFLVQRVRVIRLIANQTFRRVIGEPLDQSFADKSDFMRRSILCVNGERKTSAVCHCRELRTLAPLGLSDFAAPFFAVMNIPSIKHSDKSNSPRVCRSSANVSSTRLSVPPLTHCWNRRWQVWYGGNLAGKSHHLAPERKIQRTPFITSRSSRRGLPRPLTVDGWSKSGSIKDHCSSVSSSRRAMLEM